MSTFKGPPLPNRFTDTRQPRFVGREQELERLEKVWEMVEKGERQAVFLGGEPGSGKSRIAAEMARGLQAQNAVVLLGFNSVDLSIPYEPFVEALNHLLLGTEAGTLAGLLPESAVELVRVTPHLRRHRADLVDPPPATREEYRRDLFTAYVDLIAAVAVERSVAIFLEDMHWSSAPTRLMLSHLIEATSDSRLLVFATMRNTAPDRSDDLSYAIADLYRMSGVSRIDLPGLDLEDVEDYLKAEAGADVPHLKEMAALLRDQTGGNPFFLREAWRDTAAGGIVSFRTHRMNAPQSVRDSLERRIRSFDVGQRTVLEHAAVLGADFSIADVIQSLTMTAAEILQVLDHAVEAGLITMVSGGAYRFHHALIREALIDGLTPSRSAETHARLGEALAARYESEPELAPLLARLYEGAAALGHREEMVFYLCQAAELARRGLAHEEAAALWEQAARAVKGETSKRERLLLAAARSHMLAGDFPEARRIYREVNSSHDPESSLRAAIGFEEASWRPGTLGHEARALLESSIDRIPADPENPLYVGGLISLGRSHTFSGDLETSGVIGRQALDMARQLGDDALVADALVASLLRVFNIPHSSDDLHEQSVELRNIVMRTGDYDRLGPAGVNKASTAYIHGDPTGFLEGWGDVHLAAEKTGQPFWQWVDGCYRHCHQFTSGDFEAAAATAVAINELGYSFGADEAEGPFGLQMYMVKRETGTLEAVRGIISGDSFKDGTWSPGLLSLYTELEMPDSVRALLPGSLALPDTVTNRMAVYPAVVAFLCEAALFVDDLSAVERLLPHMTQYDGFNILVGQCVAVFGSGNAYLGRMHAALGDHETADGHFRRALQMDVATGSIVHQASTLAFYAGFLAAIGEDERAAEYRNKARQLAEPIRQLRVLKMLERVDSVSFPDGLTEREVEVLELLVEGASNKQIGDRLFISSNTAANHVRNILTKTGSANRTAAAVYAHEHGLV